MMKLLDAQCKNENENTVAVTNCPSALSVAANRQCVLTWSFNCWASIQCSC